MAAEKREMEKRRRRASEEVVRGTTRQVRVGVVVLVCALVAACGKKEAPAGNAAEPVAASSAKGAGERVAVTAGGAGSEMGQTPLVMGKAQAVEEVAEQAGVEPATEFLPPGFASWKQFDETYAEFRAERVAAQESLPVNEDGSRVWLGQIVFADQGLDARIKTFGMAKQLVKGGAECVFMKMDGTRVKFAEAGLGEAIGKIAAKKYVKVFGWLDEKAGTIKPRYIDVAGEKYVWKDGALVRE